MKLNENLETHFVLMKRDLPTSIFALSHLTHAARRVKEWADRHLGRECLHHTWLRHTSMCLREKWLMGFRGGLQKT